MGTEPRAHPEGASTRDTANVNDVIERCDHCSRETPHDVAISILSESDEPGKAAFSRQPYRRTQCRACGEVSLTRLNAAAEQNCR